MYCRLWWCEIPDMHKINISHEKRHISITAKRFQAFAARMRGLWWEELDCGDGKGGKKRLHHLCSVLRVIREVHIAPALTGGNEHCDCI